MFRVGDKVKVIEENTTYGMGLIEIGDIGTICRINGCNEYDIDFSNYEGWTARGIILELVKTAPMRKTKSKTETKIEEKEKVEMASTSIVDRAKDAGKKVVGAQAAMAKTAATLEAARIFNNQLAKVAAKKLPTMIRGYADTPVGRAIMANLILVGIETTLPGIGESDVRKQVARAAVVESYGVLMQSFKLEDMLNELFEMPALKGLTGKIGLTEEE